MIRLALLHAAAAMVPAGVEIKVATLHGIPLYDGDLEFNGADAVSALKERIVACDGEILTTPEYDGSLRGVLKNARDWLSRPPADLPRIFADRLRHSTRAKRLVAGAEGIDRATVGRRSSIGISRAPSDSE